MFQSGHSALQLEHLHVQGGLLAAECCDLLLVARVLLLLVREVSRNIFLHLEKVVGEGFSNVLSLQGKTGLQLRLFLLEGLHFGLVELQVFLD